MTASNSRLNIAAALAANLVASPAYLFCLLPYINSDRILIAVIAGILVVCVAMAILWSRSRRAAAAAQAALLAMPMAAIIGSMRNGRIRDGGGVRDATVIGYLVLILIPAALFVVSLILLVRRKREAKT